jgi:hypothetical protein
VPVSLVTQHAKRMRRVIICGLSGSTIFFHGISRTKRFSEKKKCIKHEMYILIFFTTLSEIVLILNTIQLDIVINVKMSSYNVSFILLRF